MRNDPFCVRLVSDSRLAKEIAPFLNDRNIALFSSHFLKKKPKSEMAVLWHHLISLCDP